MKPYKILGSGSDGNAIIYFEELLVDIGLSHKIIKQYQNKIKYVFITHKHTDHYNRTTIKKLSNEKPLIKFIVGEHLYDDLIEIIEPYKVIKVELNKRYKLGEHLIISPIYLYHNVVNYGLRIFKENIKILHATDTYTLEGIEAKNYDYYMLEANFCEELIKEIDETLEDGEFNHSIASRENHLSIQKSIEYYNEQNKWGKGIHVMLHKSKTYL